MFLYITLVLCIILFTGLAQIPCDDVYGQFCPDESGWAVGECIRKQDPAIISADCITYMSIHDVCKVSLFDR